MSVKINSDAELATKSDIRLLKSDISLLKSDVNRLGMEMGKLEIKMGEGFKDLLKWMIALMVGLASLVITCMKMLS